MRKSKSKKLSKAKADKYFSLYIRERDKNMPCVSCGRMVSDMDCGHFISRRFDSVRHDEKNASAQCQKCNRFEYGNQYEHSLKIDERWGKGTAESLYMKSKMVCKRNAWDYEMIAAEYKKKYEELKNDQSKRN